MKQLPKSLQQKLQQREENNSLRTLPSSNKLTDFASNDYLGFAKNETIFNNAHQYLIDNNIKLNGATGSRLISGNHNLYTTAEDSIATFHQAESALIFNSGYDANVGVFSSIPQRNDIIYYDELCHASIRDGILLSKAKAYKFKHNDLTDLKSKLQNIHNQTNKEFSAEIYIVTESVFSMDGDSPNLKELVQLSKQFKAHCIIDEAHAVGIFGNFGNGLVEHYKLQDEVFARVVTFGKALGCHGAVVLGSANLKNYLVNFARSFIYSTALSPHSVATILNAYLYLKENVASLQMLKSNINFFINTINQLELSVLFVKSNAAIQSAIITGNGRVKNLALRLQNEGFDVKPILSPTVPEGQERLRFCIHSYNSQKEIVLVLQKLKEFIA